MSDTPDYDFMVKIHEKDFDETSAELGIELLTLRRDTGMEEFTASLCEGC